ncbi:MAG: GNAT family N-acetyltransferase [Rhodospirillales bacterium]|nr:GNAT family N-acetyltransferase [Rhodospirillales bacterium]MCB9973831.1 GNAT family N-acetyltransferase [Rhodospirillales bacterium]
MKIRRSTFSDWTILQKLNQKLFDLEFNNYDSSIDPGWPTSPAGITYYQDAVSNKTKAAFLAEIDETAVGYIIISYDSSRHDESYRNKVREAEIENMYVESNFRDRGIGRELVSQAEQWSQKCGATHIQVISSYTNNSASDFYESIGFDTYNITHEKKLL